MTGEFDEIAFGTYHEIIVFELRASIRRYFEFWEELFWKENQTNSLCLDAVEQHRLPIVILSCTLLERAINFYLSIKCKTREFRKLERCGFRTKWTEIPRTFVPSYKLNQELTNDLIKLADRRDAVIHSKPMMSIDGDNRHKGNEPKIVMDEHEFIGRCVTLPFKLVENLINYDPKMITALMDLRMWCGTVASGFDGGERKFKMHTEVPRELMFEIKAQGYDQKTAVECGAMLLVQKERKTDASGNLKVWLRPGRSVELKPLKYFDKQRQPLSPV